MSACIPIPFALGEAVWVVGNGSREVVEPCEECLGQRTVMVALPCGESYATPCCACGGNNYRGATGTRTRTIHEHVPTPYTPHRVEIRGDEVEYGVQHPDASCWNPVKASDMFASREACAAACEVLNHKRTRADAERESHWREKARKDAAWHVHYWRSVAKRAREETERAERLLGLAAQAAGKKPNKAALSGGPHADQ